MFLNFYHFIILYPNLPYLLGLIHEVGLRFEFKPPGLIDEMY